MTAKKKKNSNPTIIKATTEDAEFVRASVSTIRDINEATANIEEQRFMLKQKSLQLMQQRSTEREKKNSRLKTIIRQAGQDPERSWCLDLQTAEIRLTE